MGKYPKEDWGQKGKIKREIKREENKNKTRVWFKM